MPTRRDFIRLIAGAGLLVPLRPPLLAGKSATTCRDLLKMLPEIKSQFSTDPNIQAVGVASRLVDSKFMDELCFKFFVKHKLTSDRAIEAIMSKRIPAELNGIRTDVEERTLVASGGLLGRRDDRFNPLLGGISTSNADLECTVVEQCGTLGTLCFDKKTGAPMALSNWHVLGRGGDPGDEIIQPAHPRLQEFIEAAGKLAACGPLVFLLEWEVPTALTLELAGLATTLALAAALSDAIDPFRVGQKETAPDAGEVTLDQNLHVDIQYPDMPLPGTPFQIDADWGYRRTTQVSVRTHQQKDHRQNAHVLLGKRVSTDLATYNRGDTIRIHATLYTSAPRSLDSFHVVSYLLSETDKSKKIPVVLSPVQGPTPMSPIPDADVRCAEFSLFNSGQSLPDEIVLNGMIFNSSGSERNHTVAFTDNTTELLLGNNLMVRFPPSVRVQANIISFNRMGSVRMLAFSPGGLVGETASTLVGSTETLEVSGPFLNQVVLLGGNWESSLISICAEEIADGCSNGVRNCLSPSNIGFACCYEGSITVRPEVTSGAWNVYLFSQTVNTVPEGLPADVAAQTIGGLLATQNLTIFPSFDPVILMPCEAIMLLDHVFDVI